MESYIKLVGNDCTFELDDFGKPRVCSTVETIKNVVLFVLFASPGQYPSLPYLGMDIKKSLYSYYDDISETDLEDKLTQQCSALLPYIQSGDIQIKKMIYRNMPSLIVHIATGSNDTIVNGYIDSDLKAKSLQFNIGMSVDELGEMLYNVNSTYVENY